MNNSKNLQQNKKDKDFLCPCGKAYSSYPALYAHIKRKHGGTPPGEIIKPKPERKRGRPYKLEPFKNSVRNHLQIAPHHISNYIGQTRRNQSQLYPLRGLAPVDSLMGQNTFNGYNIPQNNRYFNNNPNLQYEVQNQFYSIYYEHPDMGSSFRPNSSFNKPNPSSFIPNMYKENNQAQLNCEKPNINGIHHSGNDFNENELNFYLKQVYKDDIRMRNNNQQQFRQFNQYNTPNLFSTQQFDQNSEYLQNPYERPFKLKFKLEMQIKFKPIQHGINKLLQPILRELTNNQPIQNSNQSQNDQQNENKNKKYIHIDQNQSNKPTPSQKQNKNQKLLSQPKNKHQNKNETTKKQKILISDIINNYFYKKILQWMSVSPSDQHNDRDFAQFKFRWAILDFLHYLNSFLQSCQYEQVLLVMIFFCDHILHQTKSFTLRDEPRIYQILLYYNDFINKYMPNAIKCLESLQEYYLFSDYSKKLSELFLWLSCWMSMQQYHHDKYYKEMVRDDLTQQCFQAFIYQQNYQTYINQALQKNKNKQNQEEIVPQKVQQSPQINLIQHQVQQNQHSISENQNISDSNKIQSSQNNPPEIESDQESQNQ